MASPTRATFSITSIFIGSSFLLQAIGPVPGHQIDRNPVEGDALRERHGTQRVRSPLDATVVPHRPGHDVRLRAQELADGVLEEHSAHGLPRDRATPPWVYREVRSDAEARSVSPERVEGRLRPGTEVRVVARGGSVQVDPTKRCHAHGLVTVEQHSDAILPREIVGTKVVQIVELAKGVSPDPAPQGVGRGDGGWLAKVVSKAREPERVDDGPL
jgi:hypothetical protein